jgi:hypothetical protein
MYCREELPRLQKLADKYKDASDVQFVTLNLDENPGWIEPLIHGLHLSLTVLPAHSYVTDILKVRGIPQNWIVDGTGTIRLKGYDDSSEKWVEGMSEAIERFRTAHQ